MTRITNKFCLAFSVVVLFCFTLIPAPKTLGVTPAPDGGYPNANTAEGEKCAV